MGELRLSVWPGETEYRPGREVRRRRAGELRFPASPNLPGVRRGAINNWTKALGNGAVIAIDPKTGEQRWRFPSTDVVEQRHPDDRIESFFTGSREGYFYALDARTGALLWRTSLGGQGANGPMSYAVGGTQYVAVAAGNGLFVFRLRD